MEKLTGCGNPHRRIDTVLVNHPGCLCCESSLEKGVGQSGNSAPANSFPNPLVVISLSLLHFSERPSGIPLHLTDFIGIFHYGKSRSWRRSCAALATWWDCVRPKCTGGTRIRDGVRSMNSESEYRISIQPVMRDSFD